MRIYQDPIAKEERKRKSCWYQNQLHRILNRTMPYNEYIFTEFWRDIKNSFKKSPFYEGKCAVCEVRRGIQIHHRHYNSLGKETFRDLIPLCKHCHEEAHNIKSFIYHQTGLKPETNFVKMRELEKGLFKMTYEEYLQNKFKERQGVLDLLGKIVYDIIPKTAKRRSKKQKNKDRRKAEKNRRYYQ